MSRNIALYPWFKFFQSLTFWQAVWFLFFQGRLSASEAVLIYVIYDIAVTVLEVPSGYASDRIGRRITLIASAACMVGAAFLQAGGESFLVFGLAQVALGAGMAFSSGTDSALLYESLAAADRQDEIEAQELRAWRFSFIALALSALSGGIASLWWDRLPFVLSGLAFLVMLVLALRLREPPHKATVAQGDEILQVGALREALFHPVLIWLLGLSVLMYVYSHLPFVFGQPFILQALEARGLESSAPLVSAVVTTTMMGVSVLASLFAPALRVRLGLAGILLLAFVMQVVLIGILAATASLIAVAFLFLRMVPDSLSRPFILARIQPLLRDEARATYLSLKSLAARILFAGTLMIAAGRASDTGVMSHGEIRAILAWYLLAGIVAWGTLFFTARRVPIEPR